MLSSALSFYVFKKYILENKYTQLALLAHSLALLRTVNVVKYCDKY
jgi:hypothetical protein